MSTPTGPACAGMDPDLFFPGPEDRDAGLAACAVCFSCPVRMACLDGAIERGDRYGIFGGLSAKERREIAAERRKNTPVKEPVRKPVTASKRDTGPVVCGTRRGYHKHQRNGERACAPCRYANTEADRRLRATGSTKEKAA